MCDRAVAKNSDNTQHSQETDKNGPGGIRTLNPSKRAAVCPRLRSRGHRDRLPCPTAFIIIIIIIVVVVVVAGTYEYGNKRSSSINAGNFLTSCKTS
jgi:hypothetical protein